MLLEHLSIDDTDEHIILEKLQALSSEELLQANMAVVEVIVEILEWMSSTILIGHPEKVAARAS